MALTKNNKQEIIGKFRINEKDSGSPEVQVAVITTRIAELTEHLNEHKKDYATRRGLIKMVGRRRKLLRYLNKHSLERYTGLIEALGLTREDAKVRKAA